MQFGLEESVISALKNILADFPQVSEVILYGSRAKGTAREGSDIDITLKGKNLDISLLLSLSVKIEELCLPYTFDISLHEKLDNPELVDHIKRVGKVFYKKDSAT